MKKIEIINGCWTNEIKLNKIVAFNPSEITKDISLVLGKYHIWYLKSICNTDVLEARKKEFFVNKLKHTKDIKQEIDFNYCLGEIYLLEDSEMAKLYFNNVINKCKSECYKDEMLICMSENYIRHMKSIRNDNIVDRKDVIGYEVNLSIFNLYKDKNDMRELVMRAALWLCDNCPNYKNTIEVVTNYFKQNNDMEKLCIGLIGAYKITEDIEYIEKLVNYIYKIKNLTDEGFEKIISILDLINNYNNIELWTKIAQALYKIVDKKYLDRILSHIDKKLRYTNLFTGEFKGELIILDFLITIYNDIISFNGKYEFIQKYEKNITKYLLYASFQNNNIAELYEAHSKLNAIKQINNKHTDVLSILEFLPTIKIENKNKLKAENVYSYENLLNNLKYILEGTEVFEKVQEFYLRKKKVESKIMLYGMFSSGKSSFINSILDSQILEEGDLPTTSTFTFVGCAEDKELENSIKYSIPTDSIVVKNNFLEENNILLVDTPGFEDLNCKQGELSSNNAELFDKFIILLDATRPLTSSEYNKIKQLKDKVKTGRVMFVLNKIDFIDEEEDDIDEIVEDVKIKLKKIISDDIKIVPYSSFMVKEGDIDMRENLQSEIIKFISTCKVENRFNLVINSINLSKQELRKEVAKKNNIFDNRIEEIDKVINDINKIKDILVDMIYDYIIYIKENIEKLKNIIHKYIADSIEDIFKNTAKFLDECNNIYLIYEEIRNKIRCEVNHWAKTKYRQFVTDKSNMFLKDINKYIMMKKNTLSNISSEVRNTCINVYDFKEKFFLSNLECDKLIDVLVYNSEVLLQNIHSSIENICWGERAFNMGIHKPVLGSIGVGFSKFFNYETETLCKYKDLINQQSNEAAEKTINYIEKNNFELDLLLNSYMYILCENNTDNDNLKTTMFNNGCTINIVSKNIEIINKYNDDIEFILERMSNIKNDIILQKNKENNLRDTMLRKIEYLDIELLKYKEQIKNGIIYSNRELFRI